MNRIESEKKTVGMMVRLYCIVLFWSRPDAYSSWIEICNKTY